MAHLPMQEVMEESPKPFSEYPGVAGANTSFNKPFADQREPLREESSSKCFVFDRASGTVIEIRSDG